MSDMDMGPYRDVFLAESTEFIQQITDGLLALESDPGDRAPVEVIFRGAHSLKSMAAAMGYHRTAELTHKMEGLMGTVRSGKQPVDAPVVDVMLAATDLVRDLIEDEGAARNDIDATEMLALLSSMAEKGSAAAISAEVVEPRPDDRSASAQPESLPADADYVPGASVYRATVTLEDSCVLKAVRVYMVVKRLSHMGRVIDTEPTARELEDESFDREFVVVLETLDSAEDVRQAGLGVSEVESVDVIEIDRRPDGERMIAPPLARGTQSQGSKTPKLSETQTVRVSIGHLDELVNLVGELVILRSRLDRIRERLGDSELSDTVAEMHQITHDLQFEVLQTRMVPVGNIFNRFPRMVRDLARELGKHVEFEMSGQEIELDRTVLDEIGDPIVHLLRNAVDHGVEAPRERVEAGKLSTGVVRLEAHRERDHAMILVSDDGRGIDSERVWATAVARGVVRAEQRPEFSENDILLLTCLPGFSTAENTTKVSGRGVGMDVVKGKIEHLGGTLAIHSRPGEGTEFALKLPLTLAIVRSLLVECRGQLFAVPLSAVNEVFDADDITRESVDGTPVAILRDGSVVPLDRLDALLFGIGADADAEPHSSVILLDAAGEERALQVEALVGRQEIVVKPLSQLAQEARGFAGATILGDGRVALILDPRTLFSITEDEQ